DLIVVLVTHISRPRGGSSRMRLHIGYALIAAAGLAVLTTPGSAGEKKPAGTQKDVFGYTAAFDAELKKVGQISPQEFSKMFALKDKYLEKLSFNPTEAKFWDSFNLDPSKLPKRYGYDFRVNKDELDAFKKNGFVVSERMSAGSFAEQFYRIYSRDLPVFITSDALLH